MTEYEVAVFLPCSPQELPANLERFAAALSSLETSTPSVQEWLVLIGWPRDELDFVFTGSSITLNALIVNNGPLIAEPYILGYAPSVFTLPTTSWLQCSLVFTYRSEVLETGIWSEWSEQKYRPEVGKPIFHAMRTFAYAFERSPVFFNDFSTVNQPWEALLGEEGNLWAFDLALVPTHVSTRFADLPAGYARADMTEGIALAPISRWSVLPWSDV